MFGGKVPKDNIRIVACGTIDEANAALGLARAFTRNPMLLEIIYMIQQDLITVAAECATPIKVLLFINELSDLLFLLAQLAEQDNIEICEQV